MRSGAKLRRTLAALERLGCSITVRYADQNGLRLEDIAREAEPDFDAVIAAGGDGTIDAVINGLTAAPVRSLAPLGILPLGTVNLLAREIGLPRDPERLAAAIVSAPVRQVWPGRVGARLFTVVASCGFDAETVAAVDPVLKMRFGRLAFGPAILKALRQNRHRNLSVCIDGRDEPEPIATRDKRDGAVLKQEHARLGPLNVTWMTRIAARTLGLQNRNHRNEVVVRPLAQPLAGRQPLPPGRQGCLCRPAVAILSVPPASRFKVPS